MKKIAQLLLIPILIFLPLFFAAPTFANPPDTTDPTAQTTQTDPNAGGGGGGGGGTSDPCASIFGLVSWSCNVDLDGIHSTAALSNNVWQIAANVATDLTIIAAYAVLGYVIYGGYLYIFAAGDPGKIAAGKKTLSQAFIGLAIVMSANIILSAIRIALGANFAQNCATIVGTPPSGCMNVADTPTMVTSAIQWVIGIAGVVAVIFVVYGAISYITSAGDAGRVAKAKNLIVYSLIGLAIVALAEIGTAFVSNLIRTATQTPFFIRNFAILSLPEASAESRLSASLLENYQSYYFTNLSNESTNNLMLKTKGSSC